MLLASVILYLLFTILIGFYASRKVHTSGDFMLAGRSLPMVLSVSALFATWFGSETVFGASSEFLKGGLYNVIEDPFGAALCLILFGLFFARKLYGMNLLTLGDLFKVKFGRKTEIIASAFLIPSYFGYTAAQLVAMGLIIHVITGVILWQAIIMSACVVTLYTYIGGMWAISITDFIQSIIIVAGLVVLAAVLTDLSGGFSVVVSNVKPETFRFLPKLEFGEIVAWIAAWSVLGLGSIPSQDVFQRVMSSGSDKIAVRSCFYAAGLYLTIAMLPLFISLCAKQLYPNEVGDHTQLVLPNLVLSHTNIFVQILFFGSLISAIMSTTSATILAPAALASENVLKPIFKKELSDRQLLVVTKLVIIVYSVLATIMACFERNVYELVGGASILSLVSLFVPMVAGLYWKKSSSTGAIMSMVGGMVTYFLLEYVIETTTYPSFVVATILSLLLMIVGSLAFPSNFRTPPSTGQ